MKGGFAQIFMDNEKSAFLSLDTKEELFSPDATSLSLHYKYVRKKSARISGTQRAYCKAKTHGSGEMY